MKYTIINFYDHCLVIFRKFFPILRSERYILILVVFYLSLVVLSLKSLKSSVVFILVNDIRICFGVVVFNS